MYSTEINTFSFIGGNLARFIYQDETRVSAMPVSEKVEGFFGPFHDSNGVFYIEENYDVSV